MAQMFHKMIQNVIFLHLFLSIFYLEMTKSIVLQLCLDHCAYKTLRKEKADKLDENAVLR